MFLGVQAPETSSVLFGKRPHLDFEVHLLTIIVAMVPKDRTTTVAVMKETEVPVVGRLKIVVKIWIAFGTKIKAENGFEVLIINTVPINNMSVVVMTATVGARM